MRPHVAAALRPAAAPALACLLGAILFAPTASRPAEAQEAVLESFRAQIALKSVGSPRISPDGGMIAYSVTTADWENNRFD